MVTLGNGPAAGAVAGGAAVGADSFGFVVKVDVGAGPARSCTGALVDPQWIVTAASCFAEGGQAVAAGPPSQPATATVGRVDLSSSTGRVVAVTDLVPRPDRNLVLAKLALRFTDVAPVGLGGAAPAAGDAVQVAGFGRTSTTWVPDQVQAGGFAVQAVTDTTFEVTAANPNGASICQGDAGGPAVRERDGHLELVGVSTASWQRGCLAETTDRDGATETRTDDITDWIHQNTPAPGTGFVRVHGSTGIAGYDLGDARDRIVAFDYDHTGKRDYLLIYRPGAGNIAIVKHGSGDTFTRVYSGTGIGGYDLADARDEIVPFDYDHTGRLDHLLIYRPGAGTAWILKHDTGTTFTRVYSGTGIGGYDLADARDRIIAYDYGHTARLDHLVLYRPGAKTAYVVQHGTGTTFTRVNSGTGIGGYDLADARDRILAYDYDNTGRLDHLLLYRPGAGTAWILKHDTGTTFTRAYSGTGIDGYDLTDDRDQITAYDHNHTSGTNHLVLYRPGTGTIYIVTRT